MTKRRSKRPQKIRARKGATIHYVFVTTAQGHTYLPFADAVDAQRRAVEEALEIIREAPGDHEDLIGDVQDLHDRGLYERALEHANVPEVDDHCNVEVGEAVIG